MKLTRAIEVEVGPYELIDAIVDYSQKAEAENVCPYFWEKLRVAADAMEKTWNERGALRKAGK